jgi:hypothetical protein
MAIALDRILDFGFWILDFGFWILDFGLKVKDRANGNRVLNYDI